MTYNSKTLAPPAEGASFHWPDVVLRREPIVSGVVLDHQGKPVSGATVWSDNADGRLVKAQTDAEGKFTLTNIHPEARLIFVDKEGYRPSGAVVPKSGEARITCEPQSAPAGPRLHSVVRSHDERGLLLKEFLTPVFSARGQAGRRCPNGGSSHTAGSVRQGVCYEPPQSAHQPARPCESADRAWACR